MRRRRAPTLKLFAFRALEALLAHLEALVKGSGALPRLGAARGAAGARLGAIVDATVDGAVQLVWDHWELSYSSLTGLFAPTLKRLLALHAAREEGAAVAGDGEAGWVTRLLPQLRALDWSRRAKYHSVRALLPLLPQGAATLLELWPSVLREIFASLRIPNYASYASELLADLLTSLRQQLRAPAAADAPAADPPPKTKRRRGAAAPPKPSASAVEVPAAGTAWSEPSSPLLVALSEAARCRESIAAAAAASPRRQPAAAGSSNTPPTPSPPPTATAAPARRSRSRACGCCSRC